MYEITVLYTRIVSRHPVPLMFSLQVRWVLYVRSLRVPHVVTKCQKKILSELSDFQTPPDVFL